MKPASSRSVIPAQAGIQRTASRATFVVVLALALAACGNAPRTPDWVVSADGAQERYMRAHLSGQARVAQSEFTRLRADVSSTADPLPVARAELTRCAMQVATLDFQSCNGFDALRADVPLAERAYADFLAGARLDAAAAALLPVAYRPLAALAPGAPVGPIVQAIADPMSRLIAAGAMLRAGRADPATLQVAADTASAQGWRRAVLAWLGAQAQRAEQAGATEEALRLRRRMNLATGAPG
ncbi:hypothetical protein [Ramlibacter sp.]|uniref:hypothetical protein n=1 Tax=Ramlibacter sp. TaxID=1917967 RepID=UPI0035B2F2E3